MILLLTLESFELPLVRFITCLLCNPALNLKVAVYLNDFLIDVSDDTPPVAAAALF